MSERVRTLIGSALAGAMTIAMFQIAAAGAQAADYDLGSIHVTQPWARATPKGASAGAAYLTVTNNGAAPDRLSCAGSEAAAQCQIHTMSMDNGVMKMRQRTKGIEIKPGQVIEFKPGGYHVMFVGLKKPLTQGEHVKATLQFEKAGRIDVDFVVEAIGAQSGGAGMQMKH